MIKYLLLLGLTCFILWPTATHCLTCTPRPCMFSRHCEKGCWCKKGFMQPKGRCVEAVFDPFLAEIERWEKAQRDKESSKSDGADTEMPTHPKKREGAIFLRNEPPHGRAGMSFTNTRS